MKARQKIHDFHIRTGGSLGPLGAPVGGVARRPDGRYVQNFQLGMILLNNPNAEPEGFTMYEANVTLSAVKVFGTEDPGGEDEPYVVISLINVNPNFRGEDELVKTTRTEILEEVEAGSVIFQNRTIGRVPQPPGSGLRIYVAIFDHEHGNADDLKNKIHAVLLDAAKKAAAAVGSAAAAGDPKLAGPVGDVTDFEIGGVKPFHILTLGAAKLLSNVFADDLIGEHEFFIPAAKIRQWAEPAQYNASLKTSPDLPSSITFNIPERREDEYLFSKGGASYKIYFKVQGIKVLIPIEESR